MNRFLSTLMLIGVATIASSSVRADILIGDSIHVEYIYPTVGTVLQDLGNITVPGTGHIFAESYGVTTTQITVTADPNGVAWIAVSYNGLRFTDITRDPGITGITLDPSSNANGVNISDATFTSNSVSFNFQGQNWGPNQTAVFDLQFSSAVPEPSTWAMMILGFAGVGFMAYRRRTKADMLRVA
jgi:PEP-CTERM motif